MVAQSAATVPASSALYERLESVSALFPVRGVFLGERALSRREIERIVARVSTAIDADTAGSAARRSWARRELDAVSAALNDASGMHRGERTRAGISWRADLLSTQAQPERIQTNGLGSIDAVTHPFAAGRHGWPTVQGTVVTVAPTFVLGTQSKLAIAAQPAASLTSMEDGGWIAERFFHRAYARGVFFNVALQVGADELRWGQSPHGALFLSGNALPLPALSLGTDTAIMLPWLFRLAGPVRMTLLLSDLGKTQDPPHAKLVGWQASIQPWTRFELGVAVQTHTGGDGGPKATFLERVADLFPVIGAAFPRYDNPISNKLAGGNLRLRVPELSGLDFYYELQLDDFDGRRLRSSFVDDAGHLLGARLPLISERGQLAFRAEWHRTSLRLYQHTQFRSGVTYRERLIGNPLGPNAKGGYLSAEWRSSPHSAVEFAFADERRDPSQYANASECERDRCFRFVRLTDDRDFRRRRVTASIERALPQGALRLTLGRNRAWRTGQARRAEWLGLLSLSSRRLPTF